MNETRCIFCGNLVPEGMMVCPTCERKAMNGKLNRSEIRRKQKQNAKQDARFYVTRAELEKMVSDALMTERKRMIEEYNAEFVARDADTKNKMIMLIHKIWLHGLGEYGITDRDLLFKMDQYVKQTFRKFSDYIEMNEDDRARELLSEIGVEASIIGLAEKHWRADPNEDIVLEIDDTEE